MSDLYMVSDDNDNTKLLLSGRIDAIENFNIVAKLHISYIQLFVLPETIDRFSSLRKLHISGTQLSSLPKSIGQLSSLRKLYISDTQLSSLPESIGHLSSLERLDLAANQLTTLPDSIGNLSLLIFIDLSNNELTTLPESIGNLRLVESMNLTENQLIALPESIGNITSLEMLYLSHNPLDTLPDSFGRLIALKLVTLVGMLWSGIPLIMGALSLYLEIYDDEVGDISLFPSDDISMPALRRRYLIHRGWSPREHRLFPRGYRIMATILLLLWDRDVEDIPSENPFSKQWFPLELLHLIIAYVPVEALC